MALPNVIIDVRREGLGQVAVTKDSIMGLILPGVAVTDKLVLKKAYAIYGLKDAEAIGITQLDADGETAGVNLAAWKQVRDFYNEAGNGAKLWIIVSGEALMNSNVDFTLPACAAKTLIDAANGEIAVIGVCRGVTPSTTVVDGLNEEVWDALNSVQLGAKAYQELIMPFSAVIEGLGFAGDASTVKDLKTMNAHRVSILLAAPESDGVAGVGQYLGRLAAIPVQRKASRVKDGALTNMNGYLTDGAGAESRVGALNTLHDKGYIVYRTFPGKSGFFYSGDPTATAPTDDLNTISRNRIIDKAIKIAYNVYVTELDDDVPITAQGNIEPAVCGALQEKIEAQVKGNMEGEISAFNAYVDPNQNILSGLPLDIVLDITPKGYLNPIKVSIGFVNPFST